jgi:hypothetical protein
MGDRLPTPEELWGPDYRERFQRQYDEYDAAVAREQAEIESRKASLPSGGVPSPDLPYVPSSLIRNVTASQTEGSNIANDPTTVNAVRKVSLDPADYPPLLPLDFDPPEKKHKKKRDLRGPKVIMQPPPEPHYLVQGLFAASSLNLLVGDPGHKKSILAIDLALSVAMGKPWLGQPVSQSSVVLVEEESGLQRLLKRLHSAFLGHGANEDTPFHFISMGNYDFRDVDEAIDLSEHAHSVDARLIVIDALADVMVGGDENSVLSTQPILRNLRALAIDCDAAVVIVHHNNKSGAFRGSTTLQAGVDHMLSVYSPPGQNLIRLSTLKSRDLEPITLHARAHFAPDRFWLEGTDETFLHSPSKVESAILTYIATNTQASTPELMRAITITTPGNVRKTVQLLKGSGYIKRVNEVKIGIEAIFELTEKALPLVKDLDHDTTP